MKILNIALCVLLLLFVAVQYNDPDGPLWMVIYGVPALWAALAAFRPAALGRGLPAALLGLCLLAALAATAYYWPTVPGWWHQEVWWQEETAREGMGVMLVLLTLAVACATAWRRRARPGPA